jgi:hypothetical protein
MLFTAGDTNQNIQIALLCLHKKFKYPTYTAIFNKCKCPTLTLKQDWQVTPPTRINNNTGHGSD